MNAVLRVVALIALAGTFNLGHAAPLTERHLVGTWVGEEVRPNVKVSGNTIYSADGTFHLSALVRRANEAPQLVLVDGTWKIQGDYLVTTNTASTAEDLAPLGEVIRDQIVSVSQSRISFRSENGQVFVRQRQ